MLFYRVGSFRKFSIQHAAAGAQSAQIVGVSACWTLFIGVLALTSNQTADNIANTRYKSEHHSW